MLAECSDIYRSFPWIHQVWLLAGKLSWSRDPLEVNLLVLSSLPPRAVSPGERRRLASQIELRTHRPVDLRLTTSAQLSKWLSRRGAFAASFRRRAVRLYPS